MGSERSTEMDSGILYFTTILDDMWRGFKKFFLLCFLLMAVCGAVMYMREKTNYTPVYQAYSSFVVETKTAYGYNQSYSDETTAGQLSKTFPYILTSGALSDIVAESLGVDSIPASISGLSRLTLYWLMTACLLKKQLQSRHPARQVLIQRNRAP